MIIWEHTSDEKWIARKLPERDAFALGADVSVIRWSEGRECGLLVRGEAEVNGAPSLPLQVLAHRDEIRVAGKRFYYSVASSPEVFRLSPEDGETLCARCAGTLCSRDDVVRCPLCLAIHHDDCFADLPTCGACKETTSWMPESTAEDEIWRDH